MLVEDLDSLKLWMTKTLTGICDADPAALTRYVLALLKKEKQESDIRENCLDQLDVFLQNKTVAFVDSLFKTLKDKSYIGLSTSVHSTSTLAPKPPVVSQSAPAVQQAQPDTTNSVKDSASSNKDVTKDKKKTEELSGESRSSRDSRRKRSRSRSRSSSPRRRDSDDRRRRHDRSRYSPPTRRYGGRRGRSRERSRDRSRSPGRRWSPDRDRRRSRSPRNRSRDRSRSWSRSRSIGKQPDSRGSTPTQDNGTYNSIPVTTNTGSRIPSSIAVVTSSDDSRKEKPVTGPSPRCRDYDEKGFCMRGDLCPYDHGVDPVIVEDSGIPCVIPYPPAAPGPHPPGIPPPPPGMPPITAHPPPNFSHPPPPIRQRPPPPTEVYNPEAPQITGPRPPFWQGVGPRPPRQSVPPSGPPRQSAPSVTPVPFYSQPPPSQVNTGRQRDLVQVPTVPKETDDSQEPTPEVKAKSFIESRVVVPSKRTFDMIEKTPETQASLPKKNFDYARLGGYRKPNPNMENNCLEVRKIPREFNNIAKLNEHFAKFGTLTNIQICFEDDPEAALITYIDNQSAFSAYRSSEPVFNNRFIKVFWHKKPDANAQQGSGEPTTVTTTQQTPPDTVSVKSRLGTIPHPSKMSLNNKTKNQDNEIVYTSSLGHLKKTVFNPTASYKTSSALTSPTAVGTADFVKRIEEIKKKEDLKQEALKKKVEIQKQKQTLLEKQISQQKVLIEKLDKNKSLGAEERTVIMDSLKTLTASIDKLKSELTPQKNTTKNPDETRKEILDTELELINKQKTGEDTSALRLKLTQLTKEAQALGIFGRGRGRGMRSRGRGIRGRGAFAGFGRGRGQAGCMTLDNRPKVLEVRNFELTEKEEIKNHFSLLASVEKCEFVDTIPSAIITFTTRKGAESALSRGSKWKNKQLTVRWYMGMTRTVSADSVGGDSDDDESGLAEELDEDSLLAADDEEDEDEESRSWRR